MLKIGAALTKGLGSIIPHSRCSGRSAELVELNTEQWFLEAGGGSVGRGKLVDNSG